MGDSPDNHSLGCGIINTRTSTLVEDKVSDKNTLLHDRLIEDAIYHTQTQRVGDARQVYENYLNIQS